MSAGEAPPPDAAAAAVGKDDGTSDESENQSEASGEFQEDPFVDPPIRYMNATCCRPSCLNTERRCPSVAHPLLTVSVAAISF